MFIWESIFKFHTIHSIENINSKWRLSILKPSQVPGQVFTKNGLKEVKQEKNISIATLYPIIYQ